MRRRLAKRAISMALQQRGSSSKYVVARNSFLKRRKQAKDKTSQTEWIAEGIKQVFGFDGRNGQIEAIQALLFNKRDTVFIAAFYC